MYRSILVLTILLYSSFLCGQNNPISVDIPMRDGKSLAGDLYLPNTTDTFPTIFVMTPYGKFFYALNGLPLGVGDDVASSKYAFLIVDRRCRFASLSACAFGSDDGDDGFDVIEWAAEQPWSNGKVGTWGPSALGSVQFQIAQKQPPHLICSVPEVTAPHLSYQRYYPGGSITTERFETLNVLFPGAFTQVFNNPYYNFVWTFVENSSMYPAEIDVPMLLVGGWYDINIDQTIYMSDTLATNSPASDHHKTLIGPWVHGGTGQAVVGSSNQGELDFPEAENWNTMFALEFFDHHLCGIDNGWDQRARYTYFQMGDQEWKTSAFWPPPIKTEIEYFLNSDLQLTEAKPTDDKESQSYLYDPEDPSPTIGGKTLNLNLDQGPYDQTFAVESRDDHLIFTSPPLTNEIVVAGRIKANLFFSSDRVDTDIAVRLTHVYPDGRSILLGEQIQRMRFREGYRIIEETRMSADEVYEVPLLFEDVAITFKPGERIRLIITSSNYPRFNRNMNTGEEMYPNEHLDTLVNPLIATNTIQFNSIYPSSITFPLSETIISGTDKFTDLPVVSVGPNPTYGKLNLSSDKKMEGASIYSVDGRLQQQISIGAFSAQIKLTPKTPGIYLVKIHFENGLSRTEQIFVSLNP